MLCEPGFSSMGFSSLGEGGWQAGDASRMVLRDSREVAYQQRWLLQLCPPQWKGGTAVGELMRIAKWGDCVEIQGRGCGGSTGHAQGASKVTENSPKCPQLPSSQGLGCFCGWSGKATDAAAACPSAPSGESPAESEGGGRVLWSHTRLSFLLCLGLLTAFEARLSPTAPGHCRCREGGRVMFSCCEGRQALLPAPGSCACATRSYPSVVLSLVYLNVNGVGHNDFWKERKKKRDI